jgi:hypothetical protein
VAADYETSENQAAAGTFRKRLQVTRDLKTQFDAIIISCQPLSTVIKDMWMTPTSFFVRLSAKIFQIKGIQVVNYGYEDEKVLEEAYREILVCIDRN